MIVVFTIRLVNNEQISKIYTTATSSYSLKYFNHFEQQIRCGNVRTLPSGYN